MNLKSSFQGFQRTNWKNKSTVQKQKSLANQFEKLGLRVPKYIQGKTLSNNNLDKALNRINNTYNKRISQQQPKVKLSDLQYEAYKINNQIDKITKQLEKQGYSQKTLDFLQGNRIFLEITDRAIQKNGALLKKVNLDNYHGNQKGMQTYLKQLQNNRKLLRNLNFKFDTKKMIDNINKVVDLFNNEDIFDDLTDSNTEYILNKFKNLNNVQQEIALDSIVSEFREKYKGESLEGEYQLNALNKLARNLDYIKENV